MQKEKDTLVDPASVTVLSPIDKETADWASCSHDTSADLPLPQPFFRKELQEMDEKWSIRMARLEALLTLGHRPSLKPSFSPVEHQPPTGALFQTPFLLSTVPSSQASPASCPDRMQANKSLDMPSPLENLYPDSDPELVLAQLSLVSDTVSSVGPLSVSAQELYHLNSMKRERFVTQRINQIRILVTRILL